MRSREQEHDEKRNDRDRAERREVGTDRQHEPECRPMQPVASSHFSRISRNPNRVGFRQSHYQVPSLVLAGAHWFVLCACNLPCGIALRTFLPRAAVVDTIVELTSVHSQQINFLRCIRKRHPVHGWRRMPWEGTKRRQEPECDVVHQRREINLDWLAGKFSARGLIPVAEGLRPGKDPIEATEAVVLRQSDLYARLDGRWDSFDGCREPHTAYLTARRSTAGECPEKAKSQGCRAAQRNPFYDAANACSRIHLGSNVPVQRPDDSN